MFALYTPFCFFAFLFVLRIEYGVAAHALPTVIRIIVQSNAAALIHGLHVHGDQSRPLALK